MTATEYSDVWVCTDCYFAHHYGYTEISGQYFAGDTDTPSDREPLTRLAGCDLSDNVNADEDDGLLTFSWSSCDGCGSTLGGSRYRLALFDIDS